MLARSLMVALLAAVATGCATQQTPAEEKPAAQAAAPAPATTAAPAPRAAEPAPAPAPKAAAAPVAPAQRSIYYDFDKSNIKSEFNSLVGSHANFLKASSGSKVVVEGNCDERGSREYNLALGQRRADSVAKALKMMGASDAQIETVSWGKEKPKAKGHDETSWAQNRRSDIVYK